MRFVSGAFSWAFALVPTVYIGGMLWYFTGFGGNSAEGIVETGLGPTVLGLTVVGVILTVPLIIKLLRAATGVNRVPGAGFDANLKPGEVVGEPAFDADAAFANYMRKREAGVVGDVSVDVADGDALAPVAPRPSNFGRKAV